jgi:hypothetical protein
VGDGDGPTVVLGAAVAAGVGVCAAVGAAVGVTAGCGVGLFGALVGRGELVETVPVLHDATASVATANHNSARRFDIAALLLR